MFGSIGGTELLLILVIALLVFGPRKLPDLGRTIGRAMGEFRRASNDFRNTLEREIDDEKREVETIGRSLVEDLERPVDNDAPAGGETSPAPPSQEPDKPTQG